MKKTEQINLKTTEARKAALAEQAKREGCWSLSAMVEKCIDFYLAKKSLAKPPKR